MGSPRTIVVISIDDLRADAVSFSEQDEWFEKHDSLSYRNSPNFDSFANASTYFRHATSTSSYTPPSHASMFSGLYPKDHGVKTFFNTYSDGVVTLPELLQEQGYETRGWIENQALEMLDVTRGFDEIVCPFDDPDADLFEFIHTREECDENLFLFIHLFDVHKPYCYTPGGKERHEYNEGYLDRINEVLPPEIQANTLIDDAESEARDTIANYDELTESLREYAHNWSLDYLIRERLTEQFGSERFKYLTRLYLAGVEQFDAGRFKDLIATLTETVLSDYVLFVTSDHGEARCQWKERVDFMNSYNVSEQAVRVPLVLDSDRHSFPDESDTPVSHIDILPTSLELVETTLQRELPGRSLFEVLEGTPSERVLYHESWYAEEGGVDFFGNVSSGRGGLSEVAVRSYPYKLTKSFSDTSTREIVLRDLSTDPFEYEEIRKDMCQQLLKRLDDYLRDVDRTCEGDITEESEDDLRDHLQALGYL